MGNSKDLKKICQALPYPKLPKTKTFSALRRFALFGHFVLGVMRTQKTRLFGIMIGQFPLVYAEIVISFKNYIHYCTCSGYVNTKKNNKKRKNKPSILLILLSILVCSVFRLGQLSANLRIWYLNNGGKNLLTSKH